MLKGRNNNCNIEMRSFDIIVWGATGFTGQLVAKYLSGKKGFKWAIAGRNREKLDELVKSSLETINPPSVLVASVDQPASIQAMVSSTRVLLSTAGPFASVGTIIVENCVTEGTDYCDITGEIAWVHDMISKYGEQAKANNVIICNCCGFDSIPSDLGTLYGVLKLKEFHGKQPGEVTTYGSMRGGLSGGTLKSGILWETDLTMQQKMSNVYLLGSGSSNGNPREQDFSGYKFDARVGSFIAPFGMAVINTRIVRRSNMLLDYGGAEFSYQEVSLAPDEATAKSMARPQPPASKKKEMVDQGRLPSPGQGPSPEMRAKSWFKMLVSVESADKENGIWVSVSGGDPGYDETAKMVSESALCLALQRNSLPRQGGFLTPAAAMGSILIERLVKVDIKFQLELPPSKL